MNPPAEITRYLLEARSGDQNGLARLYEIVYRELRTLAGAKLREESSGFTLQPTVLVHEAFIKLVEGPGEFQNRAHFFGAAARAMRQILVDHARARRARKRNAGGSRVTSVDLEATNGEAIEDLISLDEVLTKFEASEPRKAKVVELRFFCGLSVDEVAKILDISKRTVLLDWSFAKAWLYRELNKI